MDELRGALRLRDDERLLAATPTRLPVPADRLDPVEAVRRLTAVTDGAAIGTRPAVAAVDLDDEHRGSDAFGLFGALFGRDSLYIARFVQDRWPGMAVATFTALGALQGLPPERAPVPEDYGRRLEASGRIPHEVRDPETDPIAAHLVADRGWAFPYFHSDDATTLFVRDLARAAQADPAVLERIVVQRDGEARPLEAVLVAAVAHLLRSLGPSALIECERPARGPDPSLPAYPVWQDSPDAYFGVDGRLALGPIAALEVQIQLYDALVSVSALVDQDRPHLRSAWTASELRDLAGAVRASVVEHLWVRDEIGYLAPGAERTDGGLRPLGGRKSAMGHALDSAMFEGREWAAVVDAIVHNLFEPRRGAITPWGIRTLADGGDAGRYRPGAYHDGQIWLFDNHVIATGLRRHGYHGLATWLDERIVAACDELGYYPEFLRGDSQDRALVNDVTVDVEVRDSDVGTFHHRIVQPPQLVQGWTVAAYLDAQRALERFPTEAAAPGQRRIEDRLRRALEEHAGARPRVAGRGIGRSPSGGAR